MSIFWIVVIALVGVVLVFGGTIVFLMWALNKLFVEIIGLLFGWHK